MSDDEVWKILKKWRDYLRKEGRFAVEKQER